MRRAASTWQVAGVSIIAGLTMLFASQGRHLLVRVGELFPAALPSSPYFVPEHAVLLYLGTGAAVAACVVMLLTPGMLLVLAAGGEERSGAFLLKAFGASYALRVLAHGVALSTTVEQLTFNRFVAIEIAMDMPLAALAIWRASRGAVQWPLSAAQDKRRLAVSVLMPAVLVTALIPLFFWQDVTGDGLEALEIGYSLTWHATPRFPNSLGVGTVSAGMIAMAVPVHWFVQLLGPIEAAARLPLALYLPILYAAITELIEWKAPRRLRVGEEGVLVLALATYVVAMCFNSTYDPYSADIASPGAAFETLTAVCLCASVLYVWKRELLWLLLFVAMGFLARPTELVFLMGLAIGIAIAGDDRRVAYLRYVAYGVVLCIVILLLHDVVWVGHIAGTKAYTIGQINRWRFLTFTDGARLLYAAVPGGLLPFLSLALWSKQDRESRYLTVACICYLALFYIQGFVAMHHFVPVMLLPMVVFWRMIMRATISWPAPLAAAVTAACLWLSLPRRFDVDRSRRQVGCRTAYLAGDYLRDWDGHSVTLRAREPLRLLFRVSAGSGPDRDLLLQPGPIHYYAARCKPDPATAQYVAVAAAAPAPAGLVRVGGDDTISVFVRDTAQWRAEGRNPPPTDWRSRIYSTPRETMHRTVGAPRRNYQVDLTKVPVVWRLFQKASRFEDSSKGSGAGEQ
ncbi:MAG: hypothetical protein ACT4P6_21380 [Gemmatimonadaceae bacterium]